MNNMRYLTILLLMSLSGCAVQETKQSNKIYRGCTTAKEIVIGKNIPYIIWESTNVNKNYERIAAATIPGVTPKATFGEVFSVLESNGCKIWLWGGSVRDFLLGKPVFDIDVNFDCPTDTFASIINKAGWQPFEQKGVYFKLGENDKNAQYEHLEGKHFLESVAASLSDLEYTADSLAYDINSKTILDKSGEGVNDACRKIVRIPTAFGIENENTFKAWNIGDQQSINNMVKKLRGWKLKSIENFKWAPQKNNVSVETYLIKETLPKNRFPTHLFIEELCWISGGQYSRTTGCSDYACTGRGQAFWRAIEQSLNRKDNIPNLISTKYLKNTVAAALPQCHINGAK